MNILKELRAATTNTWNRFVKKLSYNPNTDQEKSRNKYDLFSVQKKGMDYYTAKELVKDTQVKIGLAAIKLFLLSRKLVFTSASDSEEDIIARDYIESMFNDMDGSLRGVRSDLYTALQYGYSVAEVLYEIKDNNLRIKKIVPVHRSTINHGEVFNYDKDGELDYILQIDNEENEIKLPADKIIVYSFDMEFEDKYGNSILTELAELVETKKKVVIWLKVFLQKHESPLLLGKVAQAQYKDNLREQLEEVIEGRTQITVDKEDEVQVVESSHRGESFFRMISYIDDLIFRRLFIGTLLFGQDKPGGAYAQSQTQFEVTKLLLDGIHRDLAGSIQKTVDFIVKANFSNTSSPTVEFEKFEDKDIIKLLEILKPYVDNFTINTTDAWFKELIGVIVEELSGVIVDKGSNDEEVVLEESEDGVDETPVDTDDIFNQIDEQLQEIN